MAHHILYLHGFSSSPQSWKARSMVAAMQRLGLQERLTVPAIPENPERAEPFLIALTEALIEDDEVSVVGSSLGGFYATWLAERYGLRAVLINPAVRADLLLRRYIGENRNYHTGESWVFTEDDVSNLAGMVVDTIERPQDYLVMCQQGDETLDYRQAEHLYAETNLIIEEGGDHAFQGFDDHIPAILDFCGIT